MLCHGGLPKSKSESVCFGVRSKQDSHAWLDWRDRNMGVKLSLDRQMFILLFWVVESIFTYFFWQVCLQSLYIYISVYDYFCCVFSLAKFRILLSDGYEDVCSSSSFQLRKNIWWCLKSIIIIIVIIWVVVSNIFYFHPYLGRWSNLTNIFQMGWNHQLVIIWRNPGCSKFMPGYWFRSHTGSDRLFQISNLGTLMEEHREHQYGTAPVYAT